MDFFQEVAVDSASTMPCCNSGQVHSIVLIALSDLFFFTASVDF